MIVAAIFFAHGIAGALNIGFALFHRGLHLDLSVLGLFIAPGLISLRRGWREIGVVCLGLAILLTPLVAGIFIIAAWNGPLEMSWRFGSMHHALLSPVDILAVSTVWASFMIWQYRVLRDPDIRSLFPPRNLGSPIGDGDRPATVPSSDRGSAEGRRAFRRPQGFYVLSTLLGLGCWSCFHYLELSIEQVPNPGIRGGADAYAILLRWAPNTDSPSTVNFTTRTELRVEISTAREDFEEKEFNGVIYQWHLPHPRTAEFQTVKILMRRDDDRTILIKMDSAAPVHFECEDDVRSTLETLDGEAIPWGKLLPPGQYDLRAIRPE